MELLNLLFLPSLLMVVAGADPLPEMRFVETNETPGQETRLPVPE